MKNTDVWMRYLSMLLIECLVCIVTLSVVSPTWLASAESNVVEDKFGYTCEHELLNISCNVDTTIKITDALYGYDWNDGIPRHDCTKKRHLHLSMGELCAANESTNKVSQKCNGKINCSVLASNKVFEDPCPMTFKYMRINYSCISEYSSSTFHQTVASSDTFIPTSDDGNFQDSRSPTLWPVTVVVVFPLTLAALTFWMIKKKRAKDSEWVNTTKDKDNTTMTSAAGEGMNKISTNDRKTTGKITQPDDDNSLYHEVDDGAPFPPYNCGQSVNNDSYLPGESVYNVAYGSS